MTDKITIGDMFWDQYHAWSDDSLNMVYIVLSRDRAAADQKDYWTLAQFMWAPPSTGGYCGAYVEILFTDADVLKMTRVGNIASIKSFAFDPCSECGKPCDGQFGFGDETHCSRECHDVAMRKHSRERMTPEENQLYDELAELTKGTPR